MGVTKCFDSRPRSAYGESVAPDGGDASIRSKRRDEPRYDYGLLIRARLQPSLKSGTAEAQSCLGPRRQGSGGITPPAMPYRRRAAGPGRGHHNDHGRPLPLPVSILGWDVDVRRMISHDGPGGDVNEHGGA
jgi:hypothetical protein